MRWVTCTLTHPIDRGHRMIGQNKTLPSSLPCGELDGVAHMLGTDKPPKTHDYMRLYCFMELGVGLPRINAVFLTRRTLIFVKREAQRPEEIERVAELKRRQG